MEKVFKISLKDKNHLKRQLGLLSVFCISAGAMISSGLFILPGIIYAQVGPAIILSYIFAGLAIIPSLLSKAELVTAMPRAGGDYFYIERSMGSLAGSIGGMASWFSLSLKSAFALVGISIFFSLVFPGITDFQIRLLAAGFCALFTILNLYSVKLTGKVQNGLVITLIIVLFIYIVKGFFSIDINNYTPFFQADTQTFLMSIGLVFVSFGGLTKIASIAEEVNNPSKNIPLGMILAFAVVLLLYGLTIFTTVGLLNFDEFAHSLTSISDGGFKIAGKIGLFVMAFAALLAFISTANAGILASSRAPVAMGRDHLLPPFFAYVHPKYKTPSYSILSTGLFMILVILFLDLENLVKVASTMKIILFIFDLLCCIIMRESRIMNYRPAFYSPLYPWIQIVGIILYGLFLVSMGKVALLTTGIFILITLLWAKIYTREREKSKSALIHLIERITDKEIARDSDLLSKELREILKERDSITEDRFDKLVKNALIIDVDECLTLEGFFKMVSNKLSRRLDVSSDLLFNTFIERERTSTTVIKPCLAIPHITIPGENKFDLLIARCSSGITFDETQPPVYAVFILVGTIDQRNFHLRALSSIAQIAQNPDFDKDWLRARNAENLRDLILLAKRHRYS
jgi:amino acid transporter/mannitol/fructose-specific phosphotransferase system IIA component (Ntr-type)